MSRAAILACLVGLPVTVLADELPVPSPAYPNIAAAVAASSAGDHIVLADGVFTGDGNHDITFPTHALTIRSASGSAPDCIIQLEHDVFLGVAQRAFHFSPTSSSDSVLQDITIRGGGGDRTGGAVLIDGVSPTIRSCTFQNNWASGICDTTYGGAIYLADSDATLEGCTFYSNSAGPEPCAGTGDGYGAGVHVSGGAPTVIDCLFTENRLYVSDSGGAYGGGLSAADGAQVTVIGSRFTGNEVRGAGAVGGAIWVGSASVHALDCILEGNFAGRSFTDYASGGAAHVARDGELTLVNCQVRQNTAGGSFLYEASGGAVGVRDGALTIINTLVAGSRATAGEPCDPVFGTGSYGGAISVRGDVSLHIQSSTITDNSAQCQGGAIYVASSSSGSVEITDSIIWENGAGPIAGVGPAITIQFSDIQGGWTGGGNIDVDPVFIDAAAGDYRLSGGSPAADAGANDLVPPDTYDLDGDGDTTEPLPIDLAGARRFANDRAAPNTGRGAPPIVDMGAYETPADSCYADCDASGFLDFFDFLCFQNEFASGSAYADCDGSTALDLFDFLCFQNEFAAGCP